MLRPLLKIALALGMIAVMSPSALAGGGCVPDPQKGMADASKKHVDISECAFGTTVVRIEPGDSVTWTNKDDLPHTVSGAAYSWGSEALLSKGDEATYSFKTPGVFPYYCVLHPTMVGAVVVGDGEPTKGGAAIEEIDLSKDAQAAAPLSTDPKDPGGGAALVLGIAAAVIVLAGGGAWFASRRLAPRIGV